MLTVAEMPKRMSAPAAMRHAVLRSSVGTAGRLEVMEMLVWLDFAGRYGDDVVESEGLIHRPQNRGSRRQRVGPMRRPRLIFEKERTAVAISVFDSMVSVVLGSLSWESVERVSATATAS